MRNLYRVEQQFQVGAATGSRHRRDRSRRRSARARARERGAGGADRPRLGRRASQEHRLAARQRARAARADRAGRRARAPAAGPGDPARGRAEHARAQHRRAVASRRSTRSPKPPARRSTWPCPGSRESSTSPRSTAGTSSAPGSGSGARWATSIPPTARCSRRSAARRRAAAAASANGELQAVRRDDFATSIDELEIGLAAIAAPVRGARGEVIAALSISGPTLRMTPARIEELNPILTSEARTLSRRLGHRDQGERAA